MGAALIRCAWQLWEISERLSSIRDKHFHRICFTDCNHYHTHYVFVPACDEPTRCVCLARDVFKMLIHTKGRVLYELEWRTFTGMCSDCECEAAGIKREQLERMDIIMDMGNMPDGETEVGDGGVEVTGEWLRRDRPREPDNPRKPDDSREPDGREEDDERPAKRRRVLFVPRVEGG
ncbi:hypothetical protein TWF696_000067 [Orbilia brochopaga]|uniref:Uncharacterized protein n=1 Tax=Orbilia brochopaga TaxID=3140254 RepID=A0AAV9VA65_9PEZI